jgi:signal transduction histidine kinase
VVVLFLESAPEFSAYQELRMGFTAAVSHELRTPLARLLALLENATLPGSDVDALMEQAMQEVHQARELIDDVLFLGELETGREVVTLGHTAAKPIVDEIVDSLADRADHAGVTLVVDGDADVELPLRPRMLRVVVENLLANSIRYAGQGTTCTIELTDAESGPAVTVSDDGGGVPATDLPRLFERFYRGDQARTSRGTGLGLAIVKHIVTSAGGTVEATSEAGAGLSIRIAFPRS